MRLLWYSSMNLTHSGDPITAGKKWVGGGMTWPPGTQTCNVRPSKVDSQFIVPAHIRKLGYMNILIIAIFGGGNIFTSCISHRVLFCACM